MSSVAPDLATATTIELASTGDERAFAAIVTMHRPAMLRIAYVS